MSVVAIISLVVGILGLYMVYRTYKHYKGEIFVSILGLPEEKKIADKNFYENIGEIYLNIVNSSDFTITIERVYVILANPDNPKIFDYEYKNKSCMKKIFKKYGDNNVKLEVKKNEMHVNIIDNEVEIQSSKNVKILLSRNIISKKLCCKLVEGNIDFCLTIKNIFVRGSTGQEWYLSSSDRKGINNYTYSLYLWKISRDAITSAIRFYKIKDKYLLDEPRTDSELYDDAVKDLDKQLSKWN